MVIIAIVIMLVTGDRGPPGLRRAPLRPAPAGVHAPDEPDVHPLPRRGGGVGYRETERCVYVYIYIYIERERERDNKYYSYCYYYYYH